MLKIFLTIGLLTSSIAAFAHHPLGGMPLDTFFHGALSGIGHPLLGFDHLFFVVLVGVAATLTSQRLVAPVAYIAAMLGGCLISSLGSSLPATELVIASSLLVLGSMLLSGRSFNGSTLMLAFAAFGLFHGGAFGASLAGQESGFGISVLLGYLLGLGVTQYLIALSAGSVYGSYWKVTQANAIQPRLAGAMVAGVGLYLVLEQVEGSLLSIIAS